MAAAPEDEPTCGRGLAANAVLPAELAEVIAAFAGVLESHIAALDPTDPHAIAERDAYTTLVEAHRGIAYDLARLAETMAGYRDLPMARHDPAILASPHGQSAAFWKFVEKERELLDLLRAKVAQDELLLS